MTLLTSGTTAAAAALNHPSYGFDLNPVMVVVAKARLLSTREYPSMEPLCTEIIQKANADNSDSDSEDPLQVWFGKHAATDLRKLERGIQQTRGPDPTATLAFAQTVAFRPSGLRSTEADWQRADLTSTNTPLLLEFS